MSLNLGTGLEKKPNGDGVGDPLYTTGDMVELAKNRGTS